MDQRISFVGRDQLTKSFQNLSFAFFHVFENDGNTRLKRMVGLHVEIISGLANNTVRCKQLGRVLLKSPIF